jgi:hypothetical protein
MSDPTKFLTTCSKHCEARSYQVTVRQQAARIAELELELKSLHAKISAMRCRRGKCAVINLDRR